MRIGRAARTGEDTLTIELHPAELGHIAVRLAFHDGNVDVRMVFSRQETYQAMSQDRTSLEQQLSQAGIDLGQGGVDLRYSQPSAPEEPVMRGGFQSTDTMPAPETGTVVSGDGLVNIVA
jgi:hypothetical protein